MHVMYEALQQLDPLRINFSATGMHVVNIVLAFVMFGVALGVKISHFKNLIKSPKLAITGLVAQLIGLPLITFILIIVLSDYLTPTVCMGMILVASCPGGNISNFLTSYSKGNTELAVGLTATETLFAPITTPFNFAFWGSMYNVYINNKAGHMLQNTLTIDITQVFETVFLLLGIPLILGVLFTRKYPETSEKIKKPIQNLSLAIFAGMIVIMFMNNVELFLKYIYFIFIIVFFHNALGLITGYGIAKAMKLSDQNRRTLTIETGIHNSGLGLLLLFNPKIFPNDLAIGGMIFVVAWWGIWHLVSGLGLAIYWHRKELKD